MTFAEAREHSVQVDCILINLCIILWGGNVKEEVVASEFTDGFPFLVRSRCGVEASDEVPLMKRAVGQVPGDIEAIGLMSSQTVPFIGLPFLGLWVELVVQLV